MSYYYESFEYDEYGNMNQPQTFKSFFLRSLSNLTTYALYQLSKQIEDELTREETKIFYKNLSSIDKLQNKSCPICFDDYIETSKMYQTPCKHYFHHSCMEKWFQRHRNCPICRNNL